MFQKNMNMPNITPPIHQYIIKNADLIFFPPQTYNLKL
jgi:hypothetical protein